jgi:replicative DNA helicase
MKDLAIERAMLAALCQYGQEALLDCSFLTTAHFTDNNQVIFQCVKSCLDVGQEADITSILSKAQELGYENIVCRDEEIGYIRSLFNMPIVKGNIPFYYEKLVKLEIVEDLRRKLERGIEETKGLTGQESISDIMGIVERPFLEITSKLYSDTNKIEKIGSDVLDFIADLRENKGRPIGIPTPFPAFNTAIGGGLRRKCVDLVGARLKVGKSLFANATALHVAKTLGIPTLYLDTEMSKNDQQIRILANLASIPMTDILEGEFDWDSLETAAMELEEIPYSYINISGQNFETVLSIARRWIHQEVGFADDGTTNECLIVYDYLKLMDAGSLSGNLQEYQLLGFQTTALHNFCVKYDVPCLAFVQLNRDGITKNTTDVIAGSDRIAQLCTSFSIFSVKSDEEQADDRAKGMNKPFNRKLEPIVARHGGCLDQGDYINIMMDGQFGRLTTGPTRNNLESYLKQKNKGFTLDQQPANIVDI